MMFLASQPGSQNGLGWQGPYRSSSSNPPATGQGHLPLDQVAQSPIQPGLEPCQGGGIYNFSGQPVSVPHHPHSKEFLSYIQFKFVLFQFKAITPCPITTCPCKKSLSSFLVAPL